MGVYKVAVRICVCCLIVSLGLLIQSGKINLWHKQAARIPRVWDVPFVPVSANCTAVDSHRPLLLAIDPLCRHCNELLNKNISLLNARSKQGALAIIGPASTSYLQASGWSNLAGVKLFRVEPENCIKIGIIRVPTLLIVGVNGNVLESIEGNESICSALQRYGF